MSVTAIFTELPIVTLAINPSTGGTITASPAGPYHLNDIVTLIATADTDYTFFYWTGDASGTANPTTITMNSNKTVGAYFQQGTLRESFDTLSGWTVKGGGTMTLDTVNYRQGIASIKLTMPTRNGYEYITKAVNWDLLVSQGKLKFWLFVSTTGSPTSFKILLSNNTAIKKLLPSEHTNTTWMEPDHSEYYRLGQIWQGILDTTICHSTTPRLGQWRSILFG